MPLTEIFMVAGFILAAYAVVSNDSIQTLGTFLASNAQRPWWQLWIFSSSILVIVLLYGWVVNDGDPAYGRLEKFPPPPHGIQWIHALAPFVLLVLTRFGVPVSTTFLVLTVFAPSNIESMLMKSAMGYLVAFVVAFVVYRVVITGVTAYFHRTREERFPVYWMIMQWAATAFLWSQWLIQDLANIFVFLPRDLELLWLLAAVSTLLAMQGVIFYQYGGRIQHIVTSKTMTGDIRAATIVDLIYGVILLIFKEWSNMPMSTTWVFLGLLAGRELAMALQLRERSLGATWQLISLDAGKAFFGLVVSVLLAYLAISIGAV
jgi:hypothetical protein